MRRLQEFVGFCRRGHDESPAGRNTDRGIDIVTFTRRDLCAG